MHACMEKKKKTTSKKTKKIITSSGKTEEETNSVLKNSWNEEEGTLDKKFKDCFCEEVKFDLTQNMNKRF